MYNYKFISTKPKQAARPCLLVEQGNSRANCKVKDCGQALTGCEVSMLDSVCNVQLFTHLRPDAITNTLVSIQDHVLQQGPDASYISTSPMHAHVKLCCCDCTTKPAAGSCVIRENSENLSSRWSRSY